MIQCHWQQKPVESPHCYDNKLSTLCKTIPGQREVWRSPMRARCRILQAKIQARTISTQTGKDMHLTYGTWHYASKSLTDWGTTNAFAMQRYQDTHSLCGCHVLLYLYLTCSTFRSHLQGSAAWHRPWWTESRIGSARYREWMVIVLHQHTWKAEQTRHTLQARGASAARIT